VAWLENRGVTKLDEKAALSNLTSGFRSAEKHIGVPHEKLLRLPDFDKADRTELDQFYNKLGRPADPKQYEIPVPEGTPTDFAEAARAKFHELGLTAKQAKALTEWNNTYGQESEAKALETYKNTVAQQDAKLKSEWGAAYDAEMAAAKRAAAGLGLKADQIEALEKVMGYEGVIRMMSNAGKKLGEDSFVSNSSQQGFGVMTPQQASEKINTLMKDTDFSKKYLAGNADARNEMARLHRMKVGMNPNG
jgi:hypothetical protein